MGESVAPDAELAPVEAIVSTRIHPRSVREIIERAPSALHARVRANAGRGLAHLQRSC
jgi:hypothetical protein